MKGNRTGAYREVWCEIYEMEPGESVSAADLMDRVRLQEPLASSTLWDAMRAAEQVGFVGGAMESGKRRWTRKAIPSVLTFEWLVAQGASPTVAVNVLTALETGGYLRFTAAGYIRVD